MILMVDHSATQVRKMVDLAMSFARKRFVLLEDERSDVTNYISGSLLLVGLVHKEFKSQLVPLRLVTANYTDAQRTHRRVDRNRHHRV